MVFSSGQQGGSSLPVTDARRNGQVYLTDKSPTVTKKASNGEVFGYMAAVVDTLTQLDITIAKPHLTGTRAQSQPTVEEFLTLPRPGHKTKVVAKFQETLSICGAINSDTLGKLITIIASPLRPELVSWVKFRVGLEMFQVPRCTKWQCPNVSISGKVGSINIPLSTKPSWMAWTPGISTWICRISWLN